MSKKYTEHELLQLAGKLAFSCRLIVDCRNVLDLSNRIDHMNGLLDDYDNAIIANLNYKNTEDDDEK